jgi:hypothetical protein
MKLGAVAGWGAAVVALGIGCKQWVHEGLDPTTMPEDLRADYSLFAQRCSKCHSLARPLSSGIDDDDYWVAYVDRMRRQPSSGISEEDTVAVLRFLRYFSAGERQKKTTGVAPPPSAAAVQQPSALDAGPAVAPPGGRTP